MLCGRLTRARVTFKSDVIIILTLKRTMVLTVMRRRLSVYRVHLHVPRSVSDSLCYLESAWQGMHSSTAVSGGGLCRMIMPDNTSLLSIPARAMLLFLPCGVVSPIRSRGRLPVGLGSLNKIPGPPPPFLLYILVKSHALGSFRFF